MRFNSALRSVAVRLWIVFAGIFAVVAIRQFADANGPAQAPSLSEIRALLDSWRIDVVSNDACLEVSATGDGVRAERTQGLKRQWLDGFAVRGMSPEARVEISASAAGEIHVFLRGEYRFKGGRSLSQKVDFLAASANGKEFVEGKVAVDYRNPRRVSLPVAAGQVVSLKVRTAPHGYTADEARELIETWFDGIGEASTVVDAAFFCRGKGPWGGALFWLMTHRLPVFGAVALLLFWSAVWLFAPSDRGKWCCLGTFVALLSVPMLFCSNAKVSVAEKRRLAELPTLWHGGRFDAGFPKGLENWFNDHFGGRSAALGAYTWINRRVNSVVAMGPGRWNQRTGWIFKAGGTPMPAVDPRGVAALGEFKDWLGKQGISLYLVLVPDKERIYAREADSVGVALDKNGLEGWRKALAGVLGNRLVAPLEALDAEQANEYVYFKTSHHWTQHGAFLGWRQLGKSMLENGDAVDQSVFEPAAFACTKSRFVREDFSMVDSVGATASLYFGLGVSDAPDNVLNADYLYYAPRAAAFAKAKYFHDGYHCGFDFESTRGNDKRVCVIGNSQSDQWDPFIGSCFKHARRIRYNATGLLKGDPKEQAKLAKNFARDILDFRADVVVLCFVESDLARLRDIMRED